MPNAQLKKKRTGEVRMMNNGMNATLVNYNGTHNIDVLFSDGTFVPHRRYGDFVRGTIANHNYRIGESKIMNCGMLATIIGYRDAKSIDIQFADGTIIKNRQYQSFSYGKIRHPFLKQNQITH